MSADNKMLVMPDCNPPAAAELFASIFRHLNKKYLYL